MTHDHVRKYLYHLKDDDMSEAEKLETLAMTWMLVQMCSDPAFGLSPMTLSVDSLAAKTGAQGQSKVELTHSVTTKFNHRRDDPQP